MFKFRHAEPHPDVTEKRWLPRPRTSCQGLPLLGLGSLQPRSTQAAPLAPEEVVRGGYFKPAGLLCYGSLGLWDWVIFRPENHSVGKGGREDDISSGYKNYLNQLFS